MIKNAVYLTLVTLLLSLSLGCASNPPVQTGKSKLVYTYAKLQLLELDQMNELIQGKVNKYLETRNNELLMDAIRICLSRPNGDSLVEKTFDSIRYRASSTESWESAVEGLTQWAITELKSETTAPIDQVTYLIMLENLIVEFKQEFIKQYKSPKFETRIFEKVAAANIVVTKAAMNESGLSLMTVVKSPSALAQGLINEKNLKLKPLKK